MTICFTDMNAHRICRSNNWHTHAFRRCGNVAISSTICTSIIDGEARLRQLKCNGMSWSSAHLKTHVNPSEYIGWCFWGMRYSTRVFWLSKHYLYIYLYVQYLYIYIYLDTCVCVLTAGRLTRPWCFNCFWHPNGSAEVHCDKQDQAMETPHLKGWFGLWFRTKMYDFSWWSYSKAPKFVSAFTSLYRWIVLQSWRRWDRFHAIQVYSGTSVSTLNFYMWTSAGFRPLSQPRCSRQSEYIIYTVLRVLLFLHVFVVQITDWTPACQRERTCL